jgi:hypothetical protein
MEREPQEIERRDEPAAPAPAVPERKPAPPPAEAEEPVERARRPAPGIRHEPEPDAGNIIPAEDEPGTF